MRYSINLEKNSTVNPLLTYNSLNIKHIHMKKATMNLTEEWSDTLRLINKIAETEGWAIFDAGDEWRLEKLDDETTFNSDDEACNFVYHKFLEGSLIHTLAIEFLVENTSDKEIAFLYQAII